MANLIDIVYAQHRRMATMLGILEEQIGGYLRDEPFDTYVIEGALEYVAEYPDRLHRPIEQKLYEALLAADPGAAGLAHAALQAEHATLSAAARQLSNAVIAARRGAPPPREWLAARAAGLIEPLRAHMAREEQTVLPACRAKLGPEALRAVERSLAGAADMPRVADEERAYQRLYATVMAQQPLAAHR